MSCPHCRSETPAQQKLREAAQVVLDAENKKFPGIIHGLDKNPLVEALDRAHVTANAGVAQIKKEWAAQEGVYGSGDLPPDCQPSNWENDPSRYDPPAGCQGDPDYSSVKNPGTKAILGYFKDVEEAVTKMITDDVRAALVGNPDRINAPEPLGDPVEEKLACDKAGISNPCRCEVWQICSVCNPEMYYKELGASAGDPSPAENPDRVNTPEPLGEPANIRTELALLRHGQNRAWDAIIDHTLLMQSIIEKLADCCKGQLELEKRLNVVVSATNITLLSLDSHLKAVDVRLDKIEAEGLELH